MESEDRKPRAASGRATGWVAMMALPLVIAGNALVILLIPFHADLQYSVPGFPDDPIGLDPGDRVALAREGIRSIWPTGPGSGLLEQARLPDGDPAFTSDETAHMADVRAVVRNSLLIWVGAVLLLALCSVLSAGGLARWLVRGALLSVALPAAGLVIGLVSFDFLFDSFHGLLFDQGTWTFAYDSTLISLYPERFWVTAAGLMAALILAQSVAVWWWLDRRPGRPDDSSRETVLGSADGK